MPNYDDLPKPDKRDVTKAAARTADEVDLASQAAGGHPLSHEEWHATAAAAREEYAADPSKIPAAVKYTQRSTDPDKGR